MVWKIVSEPAYYSSFIKLFWFFLKLIFINDFGFIKVLVVPYIL